MITRRATTTKPLKDASYRHTLKHAHLQGTTRDDHDTLLLRDLAARPRPNIRALLGPLPAAALDQSSVSIQGSVVCKLSNFSETRPSRAKTLEK